MTGRMLLTQGADIVSFDSEGQNREKICTFSRPVRYAVPVRGIEQFLVVSADRDTEYKALTLFAPSQSEEKLVARHKDIGIPVVSPDGLRVAWTARPSNDAVLLYIASIDDLDDCKVLRGSFTIDNVGPSWAGRFSVDDCLIVALSTGGIARVSIQSNRVEVICQGELPLLLPTGQDMVFYKNRSLWLYSFVSKKETPIVEVGYIAPYYRACVAKDDGRYVILRTLASVQDGKFAGYSYPTLLLIDLQVKTKTVIEQSLEIHGPWAWLGD